MYSPQKWEFRYTDGFRDSTWVVLHTLFFSVHFSHVLQLQTNFLSIAEGRDRNSFRLTSYQQWPNREEKCSLPEFEIGGEGMSFACLRSHPWADLSHQGRETFCLKQVLGWESWIKDAAIENPSRTLWMGIGHFDNSKSSSNTRKSGKRIRRKKK